MIREVSYLCEGSTSVATASARPAWSLPFPRPSRVVRDLAGEAERFASWVRCRTQFPSPRCSSAGEGHTSQPRVVALSTFPILWCSRSLRLLSGASAHHSRGQSERRAHVTDENDVVIAIAASLYASRATDDALRAEPPLQELANEAWDLYHKLERAVRSSPRQHGDALIERS
jgi:hypothetical protein